MFIALIPRANAPNFRLSRALVRSRDLCLTSFRVSSHSSLPDNSCWNSTLLYTFFLNLFVTDIVSFFYGQNHEVGWHFLSKRTVISHRQLNKSCFSDFQIFSSKRCRYDYIPGSAVYCVDFRMYVTKFITGTPHTNLVSSPSREVFDQRWPEAKKNVLFQKLVVVVVGQKKIKCNLPF